MLVQITAPTTPVKAITVPDATHFKTDAREWVAQVGIVGKELGTFTTYDTLRLSDLEQMELLLLTFATIATDTFSTDGPTMILDSGGFEFPGDQKLIFQFCLRMPSDASIAYHFHGEIVDETFAKLGWKRYTMALMNVKQFLAVAKAAGVDARTHEINMST